MKATPVLNRRLPITEGRFAEVVVWQLPVPVLGSRHAYKYSLAYVVDGVCVVRFDNERGKGDHWHYGQQEIGYTFTNLERLLTDFEKAIARYDDEYGID